MNTKQTIFGIPVNLSQEAPRNGIVMHPKLWQKIIEVAFSEPMIAVELEHEQTQE